jgi:poly(3-hydroxybutyrate) depolymerase
MTIKIVQAASLSALAVILCSLLLDAPSFAKDNLKSTFMFEGKRRTYYSFVPDKEGPLPLVVLLHGSGANGEVMANAWRGLAAKQKFTIAAPDSYDSGEWQSDKDSPNFLRAMVEQVNAKHPVDASRIYLFGHSGGAVYALMLALVESEYFAAVAVHAGALAPENYNLFAKARRRIPIAIWVGDSDSFFPGGSCQRDEKGIRVERFQRTTDHTAQPDPQLQRRRGRQQRLAIFQDRSLE